MRGRFVHNHVLLGPLERGLTDLGFTVHREWPIGPGRASGFLDLAAWRGELRIAVEAELRGERIERDVEKARVWDAHHLVIVVPTPPLTRAVQRKLARLDALFEDQGPRIWVGTPEPVMARVRDFLSIHDAP